MTTSPTILDYAKPPPWWRRRRIRPWLTLVIILTALLWIGPSRISSAARQAWLLYWQEHCLAHSAPADRAVFTSSQAAETPSSPTCWNAYSGALPQPRGGGAGRCGGRSTPVVFLHARDNSDGEERLVAVELAAAVRRAGHWDLRFRTRTVRPGTWSSAPLDGGWDSEVISLADPGDSRGPLRVFAAQPDPRDRGSFTIACEVGGRRTIIRASMCGDYVVLQEERAVDGARGKSPN